MGIDGRRSSSSLTKLRYRFLLGESAHKHPKKPKTPPTVSSTPRIRHTNPSSYYVEELPPQIFPAHASSKFDELLATITHQPPLPAMRSSGVSNPPDPEKLGSPAVNRPPSPGPSVSTRSSAGNYPFWLPKVRLPSKKSQDSAGGRPGARSSSVDRPDLSLNTRSSERESFIDITTNDTATSESRQAMTAWYELPINDLSGTVTLMHTEPVACGGFCDLYVGRHKTYGRVALKRPRLAYSQAATIRRFVREADLWCQISHPNILPFLGRCAIGRHIYMVSPFIANGDLLNCLQSGAALDRSDILCQIADAIAHLHANGVVHGDIKAQNVLLSNTYTPLLCDFGLAKAFNLMVTSTEVKGRGSTRWMAPELFLGENKSMESDVYAFGMTIAEVLSGRPPFVDLIDNLAVMFQVVNNDARPPQEPLEGPNGQSYRTCWETAEKCWAKESSDRPSMGQVLLELRPAN